MNWAIRSAIRHHHCRQEQRVMVTRAPGFVLGHQSAIVIEDHHGTKIKNPHVPFVATLASGIHPGKKILIDGKADLDHSKRIVINLACGPAIEDNIAMHISMRHDEGVIVVNDRKFGQWGHEDRHPHSIGWGMHIKLKIHAKGDHFKIKLNGRNLCKFHYRRAIGEITHLQIEGGIQIHEVEIEKSKRHRHHYSNVVTTVTPIPPTSSYHPMPSGMYRPPPQPPAGQYPLPTTYPPPYVIPPQATSGIPSGNYNSSIGTSPVASHAAGITAGAAAMVMDRKTSASAPPMAPAGQAMAPPTYAPVAGVPLPHFANITMAFGRQIHISGTPSVSAQDFTIALINGPGKLAFYIKIDFNQRVIIRNACPFGSWGNEERQLGSEFPFNRGHPFKIILYCDDDGYKMAVNGVHLIQFGHRIPFASVNALEIRGDATLASVEII